MRAFGLRDRVYVGLKWLQFVTVVTGALISASAQFKTDPTHVVWHGIVTTVQSWAWLVPWCGFVAIVAEPVSKAIGPPWLRDSLNAILVQTHEIVFSDVTSHPKHHHRVTLFKRGWKFRYWPWGWGRWPWVGWLSPIARSSHTTQKANVCFIAPDDDPDKAEGVAGMAWSRQAVVSTGLLPGVTLHSDPKEIEAHATNTYVKPEWVMTND